MDLDDCRAVDHARLDQQHAAMWDAQMVAQPALGMVLAWFGELTERGVTDSEAVGIIIGSVARTLEDRER